MSLPDFYFVIKGSFSYEIFQSKTWDVIVTRVEVPAGMLIGRFGVNKEKLIRRYERRVMKQRNLSPEELKVLHARNAYESGQVGAPAGQKVP
jgi:hypothetical protein